MHEFSNENRTSFFLLQKNIKQGETFNFKFMIYYQ